MASLTKQLLKNRVNSLSSDVLLDDVSRLDGVRDSFKQLQQQHFGAVGNSTNRLRQELGQSTSLQLARQGQGIPTGFRGALDAATRRVRARSGIVNRGDQAIRSQGLKDRIEIAKGSAMRRGKLQQALQTSQNIREGVNVGVQNANQAIAESNADMFGGVAGAAAGFLSDPANRNKIGGFVHNLFGRPGPAPGTQGITPISVTPSLLPVT